MGLKCTFLCLCVNGKTILKLPKTAGCKPNPFNFDSNPIIDLYVGTQFQNYRRIWSDSWPFDLVIYIDNVNHMWPEQFSPVIIYREPYPLSNWYKSRWLLKHLLLSTSALSDLCAAIKGDNSFDIDGDQDRCSCGFSPGTSSGITLCYDR